jgi:phosphoribosylamine---glycine ligase
MKVLVIGSGGREHALAWKLAQSPRVSEVLVAPGNAGTASEPGCRNVDVRATDLDALLQLARDEAVHLTVVGPEGPLVLGIVDRFRAAGLRIFGPTRAAAQLEGSKAFAKDFLARHKIPTAYYAVFDDVELALDHVRDVGAPIVIKADGLAAGKGVVVAMQLWEAEDAIRDMLEGNAFGAAGSRVVIEEFLDGEEASFISIVDGKVALPMATSQDHKRVRDGDTGPNTGGMGAYSPAPVVTPEVHARVMREVVEPTVRGMIADGVPFTGFLYAGLMIDASGAPKVIEFNVRFGDPETQPVMLRLRSDLLNLLDAAVDESLAGVQAEWDPRPSLGVVMAASPYPETPRTGDAIHGLGAPVPADAKVFHAGTQVAANGEVLTAGGRVLCACALGATVAQAQQRAYAVVEAIGWHGEFHRHDIGWRAIAREQAAPGG